MDTNDLIQELKNQKKMLGNGFFNQELLEKYLDASYLNQYSEVEDKKPIKIFGIENVELLQTKLTKIYPYTTAKPNFNRIKSKRNIFRPVKKINIWVNSPLEKQKQKTFKQDKAV